jgi:hypothetical protein
MTIDALLLLVLFPIRSLALTIAVRNRFALGTCIRKDSFLERAPFDSGHMIH